jgi:predicted membrane-bound spermidine synthase
MSGSKKRREPEQPVTESDQPSAGTAGRLENLSVMVFVFIAGAVLMALEIVGSRVLAPNFGNSIFTWGSLITVVLGALSLGYFAGGRVADRWPHVRLLATVGLVGALAISIVPLAGPSVANVIRRHDFGPRVNPLLTTLLLFFPASTVLGMVSPFAVKLCGQRLESLGRTAGSLYAISTAGSILGTLLTAFVLIPALGVMKILCCLALLMVVASLMLFVRGDSTRRITLVAGLAAVGALAAVLPLKPALARSEQAGCVYYKESPYHNIAVLDSGNVRQLRFDKQTESAISMAPPYPTECDYTNMLPLVRIFVPRPARILFIGGGGGVGPRAFRNDLPEAKIEVVEIDPYVADVSRRFFHLDEDARMRIHVKDGRLFIRNSDAQYDAIILDAYSISGQVPFHLLTQEFLEEIRAHLTPGGAVLMNLISGIGGPEGQLLQSELQTFGSVFPQVYCFPRGYWLDKRPAIIRNNMVVGTMSSERLDYAAVLERARDLQRRQEVTTGSFVRFARDLAEGLPTVKDAPILTDDHAPTEMLQMYN